MKTGMHRILEECDKIDRPYDDPIRDLAMAGGLLVRNSPNPFNQMASYSILGPIKHRIDHILNIEVVEG